MAARLRRGTGHAHGGFSLSPQGGSRCRRNGVVTHFPPHPASYSEFHQTTLLCAAAVVYRGAAMRLAYVSTEDPTDIRAWSGMPFFMSRALRREGLTVDLI